MFDFAFIEVVTEMADTRLKIDELTEDFHQILWCRSVPIVFWRVSEWYVENGYGHVKLPFCTTAVLQSVYIIHIN